jgi:predicted metal-dependent phosphoesterase TrpH
MKEFLYETHCHTQISSACATATAEKLVETYLKNGYAGIFITDHFINGNARVNYEKPESSYEEKIAEFVKGYQAVKKAAKGSGLDVFFGLEYSYKGTDVLTYGFEERDLYELPEVEKTNMRKFIEYAKEKGWLTAQAHPFREANYIDHIRLFPGAECVESLNANREDRCNKLGEFYADAYGKKKLGGSDLHHVNQEKISGVKLFKRVKSVNEFIEEIRQGRYEIFVQRNVLVD